MRPSSPIPFVSSLLASLALVACGSPASAAVPATSAELDALLQPLTALSRTGVLYDRVLPLAHLERFDGSSTTPVADAATFRQACDELVRAANGAPIAPAAAALQARAREAARDGVVPVALLDQSFDRVRPSAVADGSLRMSGGHLELGATSPLVASRAVMAAALVPHTYRGADVTFTLDPRDVCTSAGPRPRSVLLDAGDGAGPRPLAIGGRLRARYTSTGAKTLVARVTRTDGTSAEARFTFDVRALATPTPDDTMHVTASIPYNGAYGTGDAYVYLAPGHTALQNPIVVSEGFDDDNSMNWDELYALLNQQNLLEDLRAEGFDAVVMNFTDATVAIEQNGFVIEELLREVQDAIAPTTTVALIGPSMGALCTRYALAYMETHSIPHRVRTWISFDGPHAGADIPLGLQYWIDFFASQSTDAAAFQAILNRPAAREMLLYHYTSPSTTSGQPDPMVASLAASYAAVGNWPHLPRRIAFANGAGNGLSQGFNPGDQLIRWEYTSLFVDITGDVWAVPNVTSTKIFDGKQRVVFTTTTKSVTVSNTKPWDGAPGGSRASMAELDTVPAPYGDIVALHPSHAFIPTISALSLSTTDPFFNVSTAPNPVALSPFDEVHWMTTNEEHVNISASTAALLKDEVGQGVLAVPPGAGDAVTQLAAAAPNPFASGTRLDFRLARAGEARLAIYDVRGRLVRTLVRGARSAGPQQAAWDGRDARGALAPAGVYFARLEAAGATRTRRLAKLD
jgi:hypothetical protein